MKTKVLYLPYFKGVYHIGRTETFSNANARMVSIIHSCFKEIG